MAPPLEANGTRRAATWVQIISGLIGILGSVIVAIWYIVGIRVEQYNAEIKQLLQHYEYMNSLEHTKITMDVKSHIDESSKHQTTTTKRSDTR